MGNSIAKNVHVTGEDKVIEYYRNMDVPAFALFSHNQFLLKYEGNDIEEGVQILQKWFELLDDNNSAHHTLMVYEEPPPKINSKTPCDGSFNFRLTEHFINGGSPYMNQISSRLTAIEKRLQEKADDDDDDDQDDYGMGKIGRALSHPAFEPIIPILANKLMDVVDAFVNPKPAQVAGPAPQLSNDDELIHQAIQRLKARHNDVGAMLTKIADMAEQKPTKFQMYLGMLMKM